ncbi:MAG: hypothetical protein H0W49_15265 [Nitrospirales bacterium]|nr:hypothetical protein [Nitrospirales bacterium]
MKKQNTGCADESRITWNHLEQWIRGHVHRFIQLILENEKTEWLDPQNSVRRQHVETSVGYRNGYGMPRRLAVSGGTIRVKRPRVRDC